VCAENGSQDLQAAGQEYVVLIQHGNEVTPGSVDADVEGMGRSAAVLDEADRAERDRSRIAALPDNIERFVRGSVINNDDLAGKHSLRKNRGEGVLDESSTIEGWNDNRNVALAHVDHSEVKRIADFQELVTSHNCSHWFPPDHEQFFTYQGSPAACVLS
jgi:hypothetical protein